MDSHLSPDSNGVWIFLKYERMMMMMVIHLSRAGIWKDNDHFDDGDDIEFDKYKNMGILHQYKSRFSIFFFKRNYNVLRHKI